MGILAITTGEMQLRANKQYTAKMLRMISKQNPFSINKGTASKRPFFGDFLSIFKF